MENHSRKRSKAYFALVAVFFCLIFIIPIWPPITEVKGLFGMKLIYEVLIAFLAVILGVALNYRLTMGKQEPRTYTPAELRRNRIILFGTIAGLALILIILIIIQAFS